jgi:protein TonB
MLRLRTSTSLSVVALAIGIAGTGWLSTLTSGWPEQPQTAHRMAAELRSMARAQTHQPTQQRGPASVVMHRRHTPNPSTAGELASVQVDAIKSPIELIPLTTPSDNSQPWYQLQGHLDGRVVLHLTIDGDGRVITAVMRQSSGDRILDDHALRSVHHWRFAVPSDHPDGLSGDLSMRFASGRADVASAT